MALSPAEVAKSKILKRVTPYLGANIEAKDVVVIRADSWLMNAQEGIDHAVEEAESEETSEGDPLKDTAAEHEW